MARPREFDRDKVLARAMLLFWKQGYEATSVQSLGEYVGLHPGSLYNAFGDKHSLFLEVLDRYTEIEAVRLGQFLCGESDTKAAIRKLFQLVVEADCADPDRKGCLMVNSMAELAAVDADVGAKAAANRAKLEETLEYIITQAQQKEEINTKLSARAVATFLVTVLFGLRVTAKVAPDRTALIQTLDMTLSVLD